MLISTSQNPAATTAAFPAAVVGLHPEPLGGSENVEASLWRIRIL